MYFAASKLCKQFSDHVILIKTMEKAKINFQVETLKAAKVLIYSKKRPKIYLLCLGNENLSIKQRIYLFYTLGDFSKYFKWKHFANIREGEKI